MTRAKDLIILLSLALLTGCTTIAAHTEHVAQPGYICRTGNPYVDGASAEAKLDENGKQVRARWEWRNRSFAIPLELSVTSDVVGETPLRIDTGRAIIRTRGLGQLQHNERYRLELTADPDAQYWQIGAFAGRFTRNHDLWLQTAWADFLAFSSGASRTFVIVRHEDGELVSRFELPPVHISEGQSEVRNTLHELVELISDYRNRCHYVRDIDPIIVVN